MPKILPKTGPWLLMDLGSVPKNGLKVFSCFHCGGGSTMGYKLAGYEVLGGVEIDPKMMAIYQANHKPQYSYRMGVQEFKNIPDKDLPKELFDLDILDGSPPCSSFSSIGARDRKWGEASKFREGQAIQKLDDLFFDFIEIAKKLAPKVVIAENVKGLICGKARGYVKEIFKAFELNDFICQLFLLNAAAMGVPQARERTFFIARRKDFAAKSLKLKFQESIITAAEVSPRLKGYKLITAGNERHYAFGRLKNPWIAEKNPAPTQIAHPNTVDAAREFPGNGKFIDPLKFNREEKIAFQTFPMDFNFLDQNPSYICGMSVPPFMMQRVALEVERQLLLTAGDQHGTA